MTHPSAKAVALVVGIVAFSALLHYCVPAKAHDGDDDLSQWYRSLTIPGTQIGCCSMVDCAPVKHRETRDGYEVLINDQWMKVPPQAVLNQISNPTGQAVACYLPSRGIMCFVRPSEV